MMKIIGLDPGTTQSAWCMLRDGKLHLFGKWPNDVLLAQLRQGTDEWAGDAILAIEGIASYGMAVGKEIFTTCIWIGRFMEAWENRGGHVRLVYRRDVKLFHCQTVKASDSNIRAAILDRFGGREIAVGTKKQPGPLYGIKQDVWSALAIALLVADAPTP